MTAPIDPVPLGNTAGWLNDAVLATYENFNDLPGAISYLSPRIIYIDPNGNVFHLFGPMAGNEGVQLSTTVQGEQHLPIEQVVTEGAYQFGATIERTNYPKRLIDLGVTIGGAGFNTYQYQLCDQRWWQGQSETQDGWLGVYTRFTGWRFIPVRPFKTVDTPQKLEPTSFGNNIATWDLTWIAQRPYYTAPSLSSTWSAAQSGQPNKQGVYTGSLTVANRGDMPTSVVYLINGAGVATVQDNNSTAMVALPPLYAADGPAMCDTDPENRTLTAASDPVDNGFYSWIRSSEILNYFLTNLTSSTEPWWERGYVRFVYQVPPQTSVCLNVTHTNPAATITAVVPQRYKRSR